MRGLADLAQREAGEAAGGFAARAALAGVAISLVAVSLGFFLAAATWALAEIYGVVFATAIIGIGLLVLAGITMLVARSRAQRRARQVAWLRERRQTAVRQVALASSLDAVLGLAAVGSRNRRLLAPMFAAVALGWFVERRFRR